MFKVKIPNIKKVVLNIQKTAIKTAKTTSQNTTNIRKTVNRNIKEVVNEGNQIKDNIVMPKINNMIKPIQAVEKKVIQPVKDTMKKPVKEIDNGYNDFTSDKLPIEKIVMSNFRTITNIQKGITKKVGSKKTSDTQVKESKLNVKSKLYKNIEDDNYISSKNVYEKTTKNNETTKDFFNAKNVGLLVGIIGLLYMIIFKK